MSDPLEPGSFTALITDPPYSSGGRTSGEKAKRPLDKYRMGGTKVERPDFDGDARDQRSFLIWSAMWMSHYRRLLAPESPIGVFTDWRQLPVTTDALQAAGFLWLGIVPWDKTEGCRPTMGRFAHQAEYLVWGAKGRLPAKRNGVGTLPGVYRHAVKQSDKFHLTGKPSLLMEDILPDCRARRACPGPVRRQWHHRRCRPPARLFLCRDRGATRLCRDRSCETCG